MAESREIYFVIGGLETGGGERHLAWLLPELARRGFKPIVCTLTNIGPQGELIEDSGISVLAPPLAGILRPYRPSIPRFLRAIFLMPLTMAWLSCLLIWKRPKVVHCFLTMGIWVGGILSVLWRVPIRVASRRVLNDYLQKSCLARLYESRVLSHMKVVLGNSHAVVDQLASEGSVLCEKLGIIYNGIPCPARTGKSGRLESRSRLHIGEDVLVISIIANLAPHKGHADLLKALAKIRAQLPAEWRLLVIGRDDGELETLVSQAGKAGINANIQFLGERDEVQKILATSDMGILCSHQEGFSNAVLEGMAAGLPMVVTDVGGNSEAVIDEETGLVVPPRDSDKLGGAILRLARDSELRKRMGEAGRKRVEENFSLDKCVDNYARLYECLLKGGKVSDVPELQVSVT